MSGGRATSTVVLWQHALSIHQAPLIAALSEEEGCEVVVVANAEVPVDRRAMGWEDPDYGNAQVIVTADRARVDALVDEYRHAELHVFSGIGAYPLVSRALRRLGRSTRGHVAAMTESVESAGRLGPLRALRFAARVRRDRGRIDSYLAIGRDAQDQLARLGIASTAIVPFAYATSPAEAPTDERPARGRQIVFVGTLWHLKRPLALLEALHEIRELDWTAVYVGDGTLRTALESEVDVKGLRDRVQFVGAVSNAAARAEMAKSRVLVLPSRYDGWGAVVNEALTLGVPAIVSTAAGAAELIVDARLGRTFDPAAPGALASALRAELQHRDDEHRGEWVAAWAEHTIGPHALARHLLAVPERTGRLDAPWRRG